MSSNKLLRKSVISQCDVLPAPSFDKCSHELLLIPLSLNTEWGNLTGSCLFCRSNSSAISRDHTPPWLVSVTAAGPELWLRDTREHKQIWKFSRDEEVEWIRWQTSGSLSDVSSRRGRPLGSVGDWRHVNHRRAAEWHGWHLECGTRARRFVVKRKPPSENPQWVGLQPATELQRCCRKAPWPARPCDPHLWRSNTLSSAGQALPTWRFQTRFLFSWLCEKRCKKKRKILKMDLFIFLGEKEKPEVHWL